MLAPAIGTHMINRNHRSWELLILIPHSPDNALSFGAACAIQILPWIERGSDGEPDG
jgi:hypothetical protein